MRLLRDCKKSANPIEEEQEMENIQQLKMWKDISIEIYQFFRDIQRFTILLQLKPTEEKWGSGFQSNKLKLMEKVITNVEI